MIVSCSFIPSAHITSNDASNCVLIITGQIYEIVDCNMIVYMIDVLCTLTQNTEIKVVKNRIFRPIKLTERKKQQQKLKRVIHFVHDSPITVYRVHVK